MKIQNTTLTAKKNFFKLEARKQYTGWLIKKVKSQWHWNNNWIHPTATNDVKKATHFKIRIDGKNHEYRITNFVV